MGTEMDRGQRIAEKTKEAIKNAVLELLREKNYPDITVKEITERANTGRSTLYKHYQSKADVLVAIHRDMFDNLFTGYTDYESWIVNEPPKELVAFFEKSHRLGSNPFQLSYKLGSDLDYLMTNIHRQLFLTVEDHLRTSLDGRHSYVPIPLLAQSVSHIYSGLIIFWFTNSQSSNIQEFAGYMHRMVRAVVVEAMYQYS